MDRIGIDPRGNLRRVRRSARVPRRRPAAGVRRLHRLPGRATASRANADAGGGRLRRRVHDQRAEHRRASWATCSGSSRPGAPSSTSATAVDEVFVAAHRAAVDAAPGRGDPATGRAHVVDDRATRPSTAARRCSSRRRTSMEDVFLGDGRRRLPRRAVLLAHARRAARCHSAPEDGSIMLSDAATSTGPRCSTATVRRAWAYTGGNFPHARHRERDRYRRRPSPLPRRRDRARGRRSTASPTASTCVGYPYWSLLDKFEWAFGYGPRFDALVVDRAPAFMRTPKRRASASPRSSAPTPSDRTRCVSLTPKYDT